MRKGKIERHDIHQTNFPREETSEDPGATWAEVTISTSRSRAPHGLSAISAGPVSDALSPSLPATPLLVLRARSLSLKNKHLQKLIKEAVWL